METTKTKVISIFLVIGAVIALLAGLGILLLSFAGGAGVPMGTLILGVFGIAIGIFDFKVSSDLHRLRKWAYLAALIQFLLAGVGNLITLVTGNFFAILPLILSVLLITLLYLDKNTFFKQSTL